MNDSDKHARAQNAARVERIAQLNDQLRTTGTGGYVVVTRGISQLAGASPMTLLAALRDHSSFDSGNDPYGEHDFGRFEYCGAEAFWKIDYFDGTMTFASPDPTNPQMTTRVLTVMLAEEY